MDRSHQGAGYRSVDHDDEMLPDKETYQPVRSRFAEESSGMLSDKGIPAEVELSPPTIEDDTTFWQKCVSYWVLEAIACVISLGCLGVVIWTVVWIDDRPAAEWPLGHIRPNAFLSIFVTISRFSMLYGVAEAIGQLRWLYYLSGPRRLDHLDSFESASRGPWGSFLFICKKSIHGTAPWFARFGALIMIVALAMDPFTQQIIRFESRYTNLTSNEGAYLWRTNWSTVNQGDGFFDDASRRRSVFGGLLGFEDIVDYGCSTGNCSWPAFTSLGYDITCTDVTDEVITECASEYGVPDQNCTAIRQLLPTFSNLSLTLQNASMASAPATNGSGLFTLLTSNTTDPFPDGYNSTTLFRFFVAQLRTTRVDDGFRTAPLRVPVWNLTGCDVKWTAKLYEGLTVVNTSFNNLPPRNLPLVPVESSCSTQQPQTCQDFRLANVLDAPEKSSPNFRTDIDPSPFNIRQLLDFNYNLTANLNSNTTTDIPGTFSISTALFWNVNLTISFQNVALQLTDYLRQRARPERFLGSVQIAEQVVRVQWGWFALPAALDLAGPIFLLSVIIYTARGVRGEKPIWKTNTTPLLMHGLQGYHRSGYAGAETMGAIMRKAREMTVQLRRNEDREIRFVRT